MKTRLIAFVLFIAGIIISQTMLLGPLHEGGHFIAASLSGVEFHIVGWNSSRMNANDSTPFILSSGYYAEFGIFALLFFILFLVTIESERWFVIGFPAGYCAGIYFTPILGLPDDFYVITDYTDLMLSEWYLNPGIIFFVIFIIFAFSFRYRLF